VIAVCLAASLCLAQDWVARYSTGPRDQDDARGLAVDQQGNSYVVGYAWAIVLIKYMPSGETAWTRAYGEERFQYFYGMSAALTRDSGVVVVAEVYKSGSDGLCVLKYNTDGGLLWDTVYWHSSTGQPLAIPDPPGLAIDASNRIYVTGSAQTSATLTDILVCRFGSSGGLDWARIVDGPRHSSDAGHNIALDSLGNVLVSATETGLNDRLNAVVLKYTSDGTQLWTYTHQPNTNWETQGSGTAVTAGNHVYVTAWGRDVTGGPYETMLLKLTAPGETLWTRADTASSMWSWASLAVDTSGNAYVVGEVGRTMRTRKYSASGVLSWKTDYCSIDTTLSYGVLATLTHDQGVYSTGFRYNIHTGQSSFLAVRYSAGGQSLWHDMSDTADSCTNQPVAAAADPWDNIIATGMSNHLETQQYDFVTMKFRASGGVQESPMPPQPLAGRVTVSPSIVSSLCRFAMPTGVRLSILRVVDIAGKSVRGMPVPSGRTRDYVSVTWDTRDEHGQLVPNGVYFATLESGSARSSCKFIVQR